jgi:hypothetical protein
LRPRYRKYGDALGRHDELR